MDNDVLVNIMDLLSNSKENYGRLMEHLKLRYSKVWLPIKVQMEFTSSKMGSAREGILKRLISNNGFFQSCPIHVSPNEIDGLLSEFGKTKRRPGEDEGEADAILQGLKARNNQRYGKSRFSFLTNDKGAQKMANVKELPIDPYEKLYLECWEIGIPIPR